MTYLKTMFAVIALLLSFMLGAISLAQATDKLLVTIVNLDPGVESTLGKDDKLYARIRYESDSPLRFQAIAERKGLPLVVGTTQSPAALHATGTGEALVWVSYNNPTHIDAIRVTVLNEGWQELFQLTESVNITWQGTVVAEPRVLAAWVNTLIKSERRKIDFVYDPSPQKHELLHDIIFLLSILSFPAYILLQLHMLWRYHYRWRELAIIPIFPYLILAFYYVVRLDIETSLQVTFLFRYTPLAFLYLVALWCAKRFWQHKLPPPKLYKPPEVK